MFTSFSSTNCTKTCETPSMDDDRSSSMPLIVFTASSTFCVISVSISSGDAPGLITVTVTVGKSIFGNRSNPNEKYENAPTVMSDRINIVANTGRLTQISANHCIFFFLEDFPEEGYLTFTGIASPRAESFPTATSSFDPTPCLISMKSASINPN